MAEALQIPLDFERLPEFRILVNALRSRVPAGKEVDQRTLEANAVFVWIRLYVELALLAKSTNRPGYLNFEGRQLFESTLEPLFGEDCNPTQLLTDAKVLEHRGEGDQLEWFCPRFAQLNPHFAGDFVTKEKRGNVLSQLARSERNIAHEANAQAMLLSPDVFRKPDGTAMNDAEIQRAMMLIRRLDNCLQKPSRRKTEFGEGLIADAFTVSNAAKPEDLRAFYFWLMNHRHHPSVPQSAEGVLSRFEELMAMAR